MANNTNTQPKPKHLQFCLKWPWDQPNTTTTNNNNPNNSCSSGPPWILKSLQTITTILSTSISNLNLPLQQPNTLKKHATMVESQGELEQRALACALANNKDATMIEFYSPKCSLCNSMVGFVDHVESNNGHWLNVVLVDAENDQWLPEVLHYDVKYVPCFVLLDKDGNALAKTGVPNSRMHVVAGVSHLLKLKRPSRR